MFNGTKGSFAPKLVGAEQRRTRVGRNYNSYHDSILTAKRCAKIENSPLMTRRKLLRSCAILATPAAPAQRQPVLLDQDGGLPDDYLATALLLTMDTVETLGVVVTPGDCYIKPAVSATRKILDLMARSTIPVAAGDSQGTHPFPAEWRNGANTMDRLPMLNGNGPLRTRLAPESGAQFLVRRLKAAARPVTLLAIGPLSTIAQAVGSAPEIEAKIRHIVWMGGALNVPGNVDPKMEPRHDGSAEWNVYCDPPAAAKVWGTGIPIVLCPLDITHQVPVTKQFVDRLRAQSRFPLSRLASEAYGKVLGDSQMYFWDILTTAYIGRPEIFQLRNWETVIVTGGPSAGRTKVQPGGRKIRALDRVDLGQFYAYVLKQWTR